MPEETKFITNEGGYNLGTRFKQLITRTKQFDCLVGYFYASGFYEISESLENAEKVRILIGMGTNRETFDMIRFSQQQEKLQCLLPLA